MKKFKSALLIRRQNFEKKFKGMQKLSDEFKLQNSTRYVIDYDPRQAFTEIQCFCEEDNSHGLTGEEKAAEENRKEGQVMDAEKAIIFISEMNEQTKAGKLTWTYSAINQGCDTYFTKTKEGWIVLQKNSSICQAPPISLVVKPEGGRFSSLDGITFGEYGREYKAYLQMLWNTVLRKAKGGPEDFIKSFLEDREDGANTKEEIKQPSETKSECQNRIMLYTEEEMIKTILAAAFEVFKTLGDRTNIED